MGQWVVLIVGYSGNEQAFFLFLYLVKPTIFEISKLRSSERAGKVNPGEKCPSIQNSERSILRKIIKVKVLW